MGPGQLAFEGATVSRTFELGKDAESVRLVVERGRVRGRVTTVSGSPVPKATVVARSSAYGVSALTDQEGRFVLEQIRPGRHAVLVKDRFMNELDLQPGSESIHVGTGMTEKALVVEDLDKKISGTVIDGAGAAASEVTVVAIRGEASNTSWLMKFAEHRGAITGPDGSFEIDRLADGRYTLVAMREGFGSVKKESVATGSKVTITLSQPGSLSGRVELADGKSPKQFEIALEGPTAPARFDDALSFSDGSGRFRIEHLEPGSYTIGVKSSEGTGETSAEVVSGKETSGIVVRLQATTSLRGRVIAYESGRPLADVPVEAYSDGAVRIRKEATSASDGSFQVDGLPVGRVMVIAPHDFPRTSAYVYPARGPVVETVAGGIVEVPPIRVKKSSLRSGERAGSLGVYVEWPPRTSDGLVVTHLDKEHPVAGLELGSVITHVGGVDVTGANGYLFWVLTVVRAGDRVKLRLIDGRVVEAVARARDF